MRPKPRILLIDDNERLLSALRRLLEPRAIVDGVTGGREALERIFAGARYHLILCDLMMPDVSGDTVYEQIARIAPDQARRLTFMTGGAPSEMLRFARASGRPCLEKPFGLHALVEVVDQASASLQ